MIATARRNFLWPLLYLENMNNTKDQIPEIDLKLETRTVESKIVYAPFIMVETPYMILSDSDGTRRVWTRNKKKIALYYL